MKRQIFRWLTAAVLAVAWGIPASAARLLVPVGEVVGLSLSEGTVTVAAFHESYGGAARDAGVQIGDEIVSVDGRAVDSAQDLYDALKRSGGTVTVCLRREGREQEVRLSPTATADGPRLGIYIREGVTGIGTVTYYDPDRGTFGALGHGISDSRGVLAPMDSGWVYEATVESVKRGRCGEPGQLRGAVQSGGPVRPCPQRSRGRSGRERPRSSPTSAARTSGCTMCRFSNAAPTATDGIWCSRSRTPPSWRPPAASWRACPAVPSSRTASWWEP